MPLVEAIRLTLNDQKPSRPIYTESVARAVAKRKKMPLSIARKATSTELARMVKRGTFPALRRHSRGVYYLVEFTPFGERRLSDAQLFHDRFIGGANGYQTGPSLLHEWGLTTQMPRQRYFVSNRFRSKVPDAMSDFVVVYRPAVRVTRKNLEYLRWLGAVSSLRTVPVEVANPMQMLVSIAMKRGLEGRLLKHLADKGSSAWVRARLAEAL